MRAAGSSARQQSLLLHALFTFRVDNCVAVGYSGIYLYAVGESGKQRNGVFFGSNPGIF